MEFKDKLKAFRLEQNITQEEMAKILDTTQPVYNLYEKGKKTPKIDKLQLLKNYFPSLDINKLIK